VRDRENEGEGLAKGADRFMVVRRWNRWLFDQWAAENGQAILYGPGEKMRQLSHTYPSEPFSCSLGLINVCVYVWELSCGYYTIIAPFLMEASELYHGRCKTVRWKVKLKHTSGAGSQQNSRSRAEADSFAVIRICGDTVCNPQLMMWKQRFVPSVNSSKH